MYSLDVNFLRDRVEPKQEKFSRYTKAAGIGGQTPMYLGLAVGVILPALVGVSWLFLQAQNAQLENQVQSIDAQLSQLGLAEENIKKIQAQTTQVQSDTAALVTVFNQIRPWSAMLQDLRDRIPTTVQIDSIKELTAASPAPAPAANNTNNSQSAPSTPTPTGGIQITGVARSFNDVNDFVLTLKQSAFLQPENTKIVTAELTDNPLQASVDSSVKVKLPPIVKYTVESSLSNVPASEILRELERKGTFGLVTRIRTLQQTGVIQP